jgi:ankyrin repeat protein
MGCSELDSDIGGGYTVLMLAAGEGHIDIARILIEAGADVNVNLKGWTAIDIASQNNHIEIVELLKKAGATD